MYCEICGNTNVEVIFDDYIRDGALGTLTKDKYKMYQCQSCKTIWHKHGVDSNLDFYESKEYRDKLEGTAEVLDYYRLHDFEVLDKFIYCGTTIFRHKNIADIGCGGGGFLDFLSGVGKNIVAVEPSAEYRMSLKERGYYPYAYMKDAQKDWKGKLDVITSFDVIEHVDNTVDFMKDVYDLLGDGGKGIIGTPTDCPIMRRLLGKEYEQSLLYSYQHNWILSKESLEICCRKAGFSKVEIRTIQRYGMSNMIAWLNEKKPMGHISYDFVSETLDRVYKSELEKNDLGDYIIAYVEK